jgi:hypothetical protein
MLRVVLVDQLRKPQSAGHASRSATDDDHVGWHLRAFNSFERFAKN